MKGTRRFASRRVLTYGLAAGLFLCIAVSLAFYGLYSALGSYQSGSDYPAWYAVHSYYSLGYDIGLLGGSIFAIALIAVISLRLALAFSFAALNLLFAWSSRVLATISQSLDSQLNWLSSPQNGLMWDGPYYFRLTTYLRMVAGIEGLSLIGLLVASVVLLNRYKGAWRALLSSMQVSALCLVILGGEIAVFDSRELYLHVSNFQASVNFIPWFSNADLLITGLAMLAGSSLLLRLQRLQLLG
jgi:hypothetical protein